MQEENRRTVKPAEASMDWKPNVHTIAGTGNRTRDSLVQSKETNAALTCFPIGCREQAHKAFPF